jgi:hypothetical protein
MGGVERTGAGKETGLDNKWINVKIINVLSDIITVQTHNLHIKKEVICILLIEEIKELLSEVKILLKETGESL